MNPEIEIEILKYIAGPSSDQRIHFIVEHFRLQKPDYKLNGNSLMIKMWDWISRGLVYLDISQPAVSNWDIRITEKGKMYIEEGGENIYNENIWYAYLIKKSDGISEIEKQYAQEAIKAFVKELYVSCHVMIGVSSEAIIIRLANAMVKSKIIEGRDSLMKCLNDPRISIRELFNRMRPEIEKSKNKIPGNLSDNMSIWLDSMFDVIRVNRNDAGHPKGANVGKEECIMILRCYVTYISKACKLIKFLENSAQQGDAPEPASPAR